MLVSGVERQKWVGNLDISGFQRPSNFHSGEINWFCLVPCESLVSRCADTFRLGPEETVLASDKEPEPVD